MGRVRSAGGGLAGGLLIAGLLAVVVAVVVGRARSGSASDQARSAVQSLFVNPATSRRTATVDSCDQIGESPGARIYLCDVTAPSCTRYFQFAVYRAPSYGAMPVTAPAFALQHPCIPLHT
jgi:hypothetical protein